MVGLPASKGEATRLIKQGGLYVNDQRVTDERAGSTLDQRSTARHRVAEGAARVAHLGAIVASPGGCLRSRPGRRPSRQPSGRDVPSEYRKCA